ncbi:hypothetical protein AB0L40_22245 [Patulibacter sp. NPDC049589]|uniref:hypothetical protein n=1 Tax=Patulibacter sp. NPDC049589 TaxID=3154731 RepID=UPI00342801A0
MTGFGARAAAVLDGPRPRRTSTLAPVRSAFRRRAVAVGATSLGVALLLTTAAAATSTTRTVTGGPVTVTVTVVSPDEAPPVKQGLHLTIDRDGRRLFTSDAHRGCTFAGASGCLLPEWTASDPPVVVTDLDGDDEPEVLVTQFTGGANCCLVLSVFGLRRDAAGTPTGYRQHVVWTGHAGSVVRPLDGGPVIQTRDFRFEYRWASAVESYPPLRLMRFAGAGRGLVDATGEHLDLVRRERAVLHRRLPFYRHGRDRDARGLLAGWAADGYRLGLRHSTLHTLRTWATKRQIFDTTVARNRAYVRQLDRTLIRWHFLPSR